MPTTERQERALAPLRPESTPESLPDEGFWLMPDATNVIEQASRADVP